MRIDSDQVCNACFMHLPNIRRLGQREKCVCGPWQVFFQNGTLQWRRMFLVPRAIIWV